MPDQLLVKFQSSFHEFKAAEWNSLAPGDFVFAEHAFLISLEESGSIGPGTGWRPKIASCRSDSGQLLGVVILFEKTNSYGEYIFDWGWAEAFHRNGIPYYPKLTSMIPFVPATGPTLLTGTLADEGTQVRRALFSAIRSELKTGNVSSAHFLFIPEQLKDVFTQAGFFLRHSFQYHWKNRGYRSFDDFLSQLKRKRRTEIRRERKGANELGLTFKRLTGAQLQPEHAHRMYEFYTSTVAKMGGRAYLKQKFFELIFERLKDHILFCVAFDSNNRMVAGALNFFSGQKLFGRHWGATGEYKYLHFELCYYQAIEWAIENGTQLFEAGAQGEHKISRGFLPTLTYSAHEIAHPAFSDAIHRFVDDEKLRIEQIFLEFQAESPYQGPPGKKEIL